MGSPQDGPAPHRRSTEAAAGSGALLRFALAAIAVAVIAEVVWMVATVWAQASSASTTTIGYDLSIYVERTRSWLDGDGFYRARQLAGPYAIETGDALYPPPAILLFLPWALGAPLVLWWAIPITIGAISLYRIRPQASGWGLMAGIVLLYPRTGVAFVLGNPSIWVFAAVLAGAAFGWPAVGALLKPAMAPFALIGANRRSWWRALGAMVLIAIPFSAMWPDYVRVLSDARNQLGPQYIYGDIPIALVLSIVGLRARRGTAGGSVRFVARLGPAYVRVRSR